MLGVDELVLDAWVKSCSADGNYMRTLRYMITLYSEFLTERGVGFGYATHGDVASFIAWLEAEHTASVSSRVLNAVKRFYRWCSDEGICADVSKSAFPNESHLPYTRAPLSAVDAKSIIRHCADSRSRALCSLLIRAALKPREVLAVNVGDVLLVGKAGEVRLVDGGFAALTRACCADLRPYLELRQSQSERDEPLFVGAGNRNSGGRLTGRSVRGIAVDSFERAGLTGSAGDYNLASAAVELAVMEREPADVVLSLGDRTYALRKAHARQKLDTIRPTQRK